MQVPISKRLKEGKQYKAMKKVVYSLLAILILSGISASMGNSPCVDPSRSSEQHAIFESSGISTDENYIYSNSEIKIVYPLFSMPIILAEESNFTAMVNFSGSPDSWECTISTAYDSVYEEFSLPIEGIGYNATTNIWSLSVQVPYGVDDDLYNITITAKGDWGASRAEEPRAVSIVKEFKDSFSFAHLTDFHIGDPRGLKVDISKTIGWKAARKSVEEINLLNPDFVIITGDLVFGQLYPFEYSIEYRKCYEILQQFDVPTFLCPGNHDGYIQLGQDGFKLWKEFIGPLYYSFDYGKCHFTSVNSYDWPAMSRWAISYVPFQWGGNIGEEQMKWIEKDLQHSTNAKARFIMLHHNPLWETKNDSLLKNKNYTGRAKLLGLIEKYDVNAVFAGHVHYDNVTTQNDTLYITTTTVASGLSAEDAYWGYRIIGVNDDKIVSYNYKEPKYSIPSYKLNNTYSINDGSASTVNADIENDLEMDITARLHFYVPAGEYMVENGEIIKETAANGIERVDVDVSVPAINSMNVIIHPS